MIEQWLWATALFILIGLIAFFGIRKLVFRDRQQVMVNNYLKDIREALPHHPIESKVADTDESDGNRMEETNAASTMENQF